MSNVCALAGLALLRSEEPDLGNVLLWIVAAVVFIGGPLIRSIREARGKSRTEPDESSRRAKHDRALEGRRAFEELLRRGTMPAPPPLTDAPPPAARRAPDDSSQARGRSAAKKALTKIEALPPAPLTRPEFEAEEAATDEAIAARVKSRDRAELERQAVERIAPQEIAREECAASSSQREGVEPVPAEAVRAPASETASGRVPPAASRRPFSGSSVLSGAGVGDRRADLRRALVMNELLGRPVALRETSDARAPIGLRG
jgi:hypothetical protein